MKKCVYTLNINYPKAITDLTYPLMRAYARKIGAEFTVLTGNPWPGFPVVYAKFQIHELGRENDWNIYFDSDVIVHPALFDITECIQKDTVMFCDNRDLAGNRFVMDDYFRRDGRWISACSWFAASSNWCHDLWTPLEPMDISAVIRRIIPQPVELDAGITASHLLDDYVMSLNIARYGLKYKRFREVLKELECEGQNYFYHNHLVSESTKSVQMRLMMDNWKIQRLDPQEREVLVALEMELLTRSVSAAVKG